jgi:hypothetical protein
MGFLLLLEALRSVSSSLSQPPSASICRFLFLAEH